MRFDDVVVIDVDDPRFRQVIDLRAAAYAAKLGRAPGGVDTDEFDSTAAVFAAFVSGTIVGTVRVCPEPEQRAFDYQAYPDHSTAWPPLDQCITMSRLAAAPDWHGRGLLDPLQAIAIEAARRLNRAYVVAGAGTLLVSKYVAVGWRATGVRYRSHLGPPSEFIVRNVSMLSR